MASGHARTTRKLKPWLVEQIESGRYSGLTWDDVQKTCFRIPWKHAGKQDFRHDEDAAIFKAWAMYKKKYENGEKVDAASWKTRLRCALNKSPEFQELRERSRLDISEPYKVYRIVPPEEQAITTSKTQSKKRKSTTYSRSSSSDETEPVEKKPQIKQEFEVPVVTSSVFPEDSGIGSDLSNTDTPTVTQHFPEFEPSTNKRGYFYILPCTPSISPLAFASHDQRKDLRITLTYSGIEVSKKVVQSGECKLSAKAPLDKCLSGMEHVLLPAPGDKFQADIRERTEELLSFLQSGVMLASNTDGIFAQRQKSCSGRIYWTGPSNSDEVINKLERDALVKLFDTRKFLRDLETYKAKGGTPPDCQVTLCFGEEFSEHSHTTDKLITAKIEQVLASEMVRQATESLFDVQFPDEQMQNPSSPYLITLLPVTTLDTIPEFS